MQHYIYSRKKLESEREGKLNREIRELLKKDSINREGPHCLQPDALQPIAKPDQANPVSLFQCYLIEYK